MNYEKEQLKSLLLQLLDKFVEVCEANGLKYYLAYGSVLGAVRHQGLIPWDDDIDVYLMRDDYEKLQRLPQSVWGENMQLASWRTNKNYRYHFLKVEMTNTTVIELFDPIYVGGVYLDIFPLDIISDDAEERANQLKKLCSFESKYYHISAIPSNKIKDLYHYIKFRVLRYYYLHQNILEDWERVAVSTNKGTLYVADLHGNPRVVMKQSWFGEGKMLTYEGKKYRVPADTDAYLTRWYGDYMTPPPIDKRYGHIFSFIDVTHRLEGRELKTAIKKVKKDVSFKYNIKNEIDFILRRFGR